MSTIVYLIRHAEAEGNVYRRCHGQYNSLLTPRGLKQAQCLAERMKDVPLDAVYSSDLERARRTAQAVAEPHGLSVQTRAGMREIDMGKWEDIPWAGFAKFDKAAYDVWCDTPWLSHLEGGETIMQAGHRAYEELTRIAAENDGKSVAVVGHGTAIRGILTLANGLPDEKMMEVGWGDNTCIAKLIFDGGSVTVEYQNDNSHVPQALSTFASLKWSGDKDVPVSPQLWYAPVDLSSDTERGAMLHLYGEMLRSMYGAAEFGEGELLASAQAAQQVDPSAVTFGLLDDEVVALVMVDLSQDDAGIVRAFSVTEEQRNRGFGPQLIGQAVSVSRRQGRRYLRMTMPEGLRALDFYRAQGLAELHRDGDILTLQRDISVPKLS